MEKTKLLTTDERYTHGKKLTEMLKVLLGTKNIGTVQKASIKIEVNEPIEVKLVTWL